MAHRPVFVNSYGWHEFGQMYANQLAAAGGYVLAKLAITDIDGTYRGVGFSVSGMPEGLYC